MRSETFGRLLKAGIGSIVTVAGKTAPIVEDELGSEIGVAPTTIQYYKAGNVPAEPRTIEILARACVRRGLLGREWLQRFLHEARYPAPDKLLDQLCPPGPARQQPPRIYENLPAPTYSQFIMRPQALAEVVEGLSKRSAAVLIVGLGGNGKTSLAREVAARCLRGEGDAPQFDAAVWVSDKDRPGTTNLSVVLDEIARTLDYPGFTQFEHEEKRREVEQLLRRQRVLVVVDNFETITDGALLAWLLNLPEPSKALITTREYRREFRRSSWPVDLRGMTEEEARELIAERVRVLKIEKLVGDPTQLEPLLAATGGNPKAIEMTMGLLKYEHRPLQQIVDDLYAARGEIFDDLFARAWALLDEAARRVLLSATFFPDSACAEALAATADAYGFTFDRAMEWLVDLALLDVQQADLATVPRYLLHPLVRAFADAQLKKQVRFEEGARERWLGWYAKLIYEADYLNDFDKLESLDSEQETVYTLINWCFENNRYGDVIKFGDFSHYYYIRGLWDKKLIINIICARSAHNASDYSAESMALCYAVDSLSLQGNISDAGKYFQMLCRITQSIELPSDNFLEFQKSTGLYSMALRDLDAAQQAWQNILDFAAQLAPTKFVNKAIANSSGWLANCLYQKGLVSEAEELYYRSLQKAKEFGYRRNVTFAQLRLAEINIDRENLETAAERLRVCSEQAHLRQDRECIAHVQYLYARFHTLRGDLPAAHAALTEATDLYERLGMRRELAEAREELARLETTIASASEPAPT